MSLYVYVVFCLPGCVSVWVFALFICLFVCLLVCFLACLVVWFSDWLIDWLFDWLIDRLIDRSLALFIYLLVVCFPFRNSMNTWICVVFAYCLEWSEGLWINVAWDTWYNWKTCHLAGRPPQVLDKQEDKGMVEGRWCTVEVQCFFCISHGIRIVHETCAKMRFSQQDAWTFVNPNCKGWIWNAALA